MTKKIIFNTVEEAKKYCPSVESIKFKAGQSGTWVFAKKTYFGYLTATFLSKKDGTLFMNSATDGICPSDTHNPQIVYSKAEEIKAKKSGATVCVLIAAPVVSTYDGNIQNISFQRIRDQDNYGSSDGKVIRCNYKYTGKINPEISNLPVGLLILRSQND